MKDYYINPAGSKETVGPISEEQLLQFLNTGAYSWNSLIWCDGMAEWAPARNVFEAPVPPALPVGAPVGKPGAPARSIAAIREKANARLAGTPAPKVPKASSICAIVFGSILCCLPTLVLGIIALCVGGKVRPLWENGDFDAAKARLRATESLNMWAWIAFIVAMIGNILYMLVNM